MRSTRFSALTAFASLLSSQLVTAQTSTTCNPLHQQCPANPALGTSKNIDFTSEQSADFKTTGPVTYDGSNGATFTISKSGDNPTIASNWYIMFGKVDIVMKAATGTGIVSSLVMQSDDLDEIDWEILGSQPDKVQTNYFGKGQTGSYDRGSTSDNPGAATEYKTYTIDWTSDQIVWQLNGGTIRTLQASQAGGQYPQTPLQLKLGSWAGGDSTNEPGVIAWAGGNTDYSSGPYKMYIKSVTVQDYSTGKTYSYSGTDGTWTAVKSDGGSVNGGKTQVSSQMSPSAGTSSSVGIPAGWAGTHAEPSQTFTKPSVYPWVAGPQSSDTSSQQSIGAAHPIMPTSSATATAVAVSSASSQASASAGSSFGGSAGAANTATPGPPFRADGGAGAGAGAAGPYNPPAGASGVATSIFSTSALTTPAKTGSPTPAAYRGAAGRLEITFAAAFAGMAACVALAL